jgi:hypothetical protein
MRNAFRTIGRILLTIIVLPYAIVVMIPLLAFFAFVFAWNLAHWVWSNHKWKSLLAQQGRFRNPNITIAELRNGTLIVDSPTLGWGLLQCWWTPDELREITPHVVPSEDDREAHIQTDPDGLEMPFDSWVHTNYLHATTGSAILLSTRRGDRVAERWARLNPDLDVVHSWSGPVAWVSEDRKSV